jgi:lysophospholipase L1-like esterase
VDRAPGLTWSKFIVMKKIYKYTVFLLVAWGILLVLLVGLFFAADMYMHYHFRDQQGYNWRGYRGATVGRKAPAEVRIACFGGSTTYGYGVHYTRTWPVYLEEELRRRLRSAVSVVNLGANNQGMYGISYDVKAYRDLDYDLAIIYNGYNDSSPRTLNTINFRGSDILFRLFGYKSILTLYLAEKGAMMMYGRKNLDRWYRGDKPPKQTGIRFSMGLALNKMDKLISWVNSALVASDREAQAMIRSQKGKPFGAYLVYLAKTLDWLLSHHKKVIVVCQPGWYNTVQQRLVRELLRTKYGDRVVYLNLSSAVSIKDKSLCYDGMHLTPKGNRLLAGHMVAAVIAALEKKKTPGGRAGSARK